MRAEDYLLRHYNPKLRLVSESDDPGSHWLSGELKGFYWSYNQTYWLYSDNLFASLALRADNPQVANEIVSSIESYKQPASNLFEVVGGQRVDLPLHEAEDYIVSENQSYVVMIRRHNSTRIAFGNYVDFWMYEALDYDIRGNSASAVFLVRRAETLWHREGLCDWSFTLYDHMYSNQKLALLLFTARAIGVQLNNENQMEAHLWSMQNPDGGIASLSDSTGRKAGSSNTETTALTLLIYNRALIEIFPKADSSASRDSGVIVVFVLVAFAAVLLYRKKIGSRIRMKNVYESRDA